MLAHKSTKNYGVLYLLVNTSIKVCSFLVSFFSFRCSFFVLSLLFNFLLTFLLAGAILCCGRILSQDFFFLISGNFFLCAVRHEAFVLLGSQTVEVLGVAGVAHVEILISPKETNTLQNPRVRAHVASEEEKSDGEYTHLPIFFTSHTTTPRAATFLLSSHLFCFLAPHDFFPSLAPTRKLLLCDIKNGLDDGRAFFNLEQLQPHTRLY